MGGKRGGRGGRGYLEDEAVLLLENGVGRLARATSDVLGDVLLQEVLELLRLEAAADRELLVLTQVTGGTYATQ